MEKAAPAADLRDGVHGLLDLPQFDAVAHVLDLEILSPHIAQAAVRQVLCQVPGPVDRLKAAVIQGILYKCCRRCLSCSRL